MGERILVYGQPGTGKSYQFLKIAQFVAPSRCYVLDTDDAYPRMLETDFRDLENVEVYPVFEWDDWKATITDVLARAKPGDWICIDRADVLWEAAQDYFIQQVFGEDTGDFFLRARKELEQTKGKGLTPLDGWKDWCVDPETEILTSDGWKRYDQLSNSDKVLVLDPERWGTRWEPLQDVYVGSPRLRRMVLMDGASHSSLTTPQHRWLVQVHHRENGGYTFRPKWRTTETLKKNDRIPMAAPHLEAPAIPKYKDELVELVAWYWTEGWCSGRNRPSLQGGIGQSAKTHPEYVENIRRCLHALFGSDGWSEYQRDNGTVIFRLNAAPMRILDQLAPGKKPSYEFIRSLTEHQLRLFIDTCVAGDGQRKPSQTYWEQADEDSIRRFEFACALAGIPTRTREVSTRYTGHFGSKRLYQVSLLSSTGAWPVGAASQLIHHARHGRPARAKVAEVAYEGVVWCPQTPSGTWLARRHGTVYFTGNSVINRVYRQLWVKLIVPNMPANLYIATATSQIEKQDEKEIQESFSFLGVKPSGQKHLPYGMHTILYLDRIKEGWRVTTVKDRGRKYLDKQKLISLPHQYLLSVAGWRAPKEKGGDK